MTTRQAALGTALVVLTMGCGSKQTEAPYIPPAVADRVEKARPVLPPAPEPLYDERGNLLGSTERVAGLVIPRGVKSVLRESRRYVYETAVPTRKVVRYFGNRLITGDVQPVGEGAIYRRATSRDAVGGVVKMDVSIFNQAGGTTRIEIREIPPMPVHPVSPQEVEAHFKKLAEKAR